MKFNLFDTQDMDFRTLLEQFGQEIQVNNSSTAAIVTNTPLQENDDKYISTSIPLRRGDHVIYNNKEWYVINEIQSKRYDSYKAIIRCCEQRVRFNVSPYNSHRAYVGYDVKEFPVIVSTTKDMGLSYSTVSGVPMYLPDGQLSMMVQDNSDTQTIYRAVSGASESMRLHNVIFNNCSWRLIGADAIKSGLISFTLEADTFGAYDDKEQRIAWVNSHDGWSGSIGDSFYSDLEEDSVDPSDLEAEDKPIW